MRVVLGSDMARAPGGHDAWPSVGRAVGEAVPAGEADCGILCWTGPPGRGGAGGLRAMIDGLRDR